MRGLHNSRKTRIWHASRSEKSGRLVAFFGQSKNLFLQSLEHVIRLYYNPDCRYDNCTTTEVETMKAHGTKDIPAGTGAKPLAGQKPLIVEDETMEANTQQVTIRVSTQAVAILQAFSDKQGVKRNRLFDEAVQTYAALLAAGMRVAK